MLVVLLIETDALNPKVEVHGQYYDPMDVMTAQGELFFEDRPFSFTTECVRIPLCNDGPTY